MATALIVTDIQDLAEAALRMMERNMRAQVPMCEDVLAVATGATS